MIEETVIKGVLPKIETGKLTDPDDTTLNEFLSLLDAEIANTDAKIYTMVLNSSLESRRAVRVLFGVFGFSLALSLAVGLWVVMDLKGQIRRMIDATEHVAQGPIHHANPRGRPPGDQGAIPVVQQDGRTLGGAGKAQGELYRQRYS
jgi:hypothetical protein